MPRVSANPLLVQTHIPSGITYRQYLIAQIAAGAVTALYGHGTYAELIAPQIIKLADEILKALENENA